MPLHPARRGQRDGVAARSLPHAGVHRSRPARRGHLHHARRSRPATPRGRKMSRGWSEARRILCVRLDNMGDALMTTPAMRALRDSAPGRSITLLGSGSGVKVAEHIPEIDETIAYAAPWMKLAGAKSPGDDLEMVALLASRHFDAAVIFTVYSQSPLPAALLCHL